MRVRLRGVTENCHLGSLENGQEDCQQSGIFVKELHTTHVDVSSIASEARCRGATRNWGIMAERRHGHRHIFGILDERPISAGTAVDTHSISQEHGDEVGNVSDTMSRCVVSMRFLNGQTIYGHVL